MGVYQQIMAGKVVYPPGMRSAAKEIIQRLLEANPTKRLGHAKVQRDPFFRSVDFEKLELKEQTAPWVPTLKSKIDTSYFKNARADDMSLEETELELNEDDMSAGFLKDISRLNNEFSQL